MSIEDQRRSTGDHPALVGLGQVAARGKGGDFPHGDIYPVGLDLFFKVDTVGNQGRIAPDQFQHMFPGQYTVFCCHIKPALNIFIMLYYSTGKPQSQANYRPADTKEDTDGRSGQSE